jgi:hypothetical protein
MLRLCNDTSIQNSAVSWRVRREIVFLSEFSDIQVSGTSENAGRLEEVSI